MGRPSKGCFTCRQRRVKCDLRKPYCRRCEVSKSPCAGYRDEWTAFHREQNAYAEKQVQRRVRKTNEERENTAQTGYTVTPHVIHIGADVLSINGFCLNYAINSGIAMFNVLPTLYTDSALNCFQDAIRAVAFASLARQLCQSGLLVKAQHHYGKAIRSTNNSLCDAAIIKSNSLLMTIFVLGLYQTIMAEPSKTKQAYSNDVCHPHSRGGLLLLRYRAENQLYTQLDRKLFAFFYHIALTETFMGREPFIPDLTELDKFSPPWADRPALEPVVRRAIQFKTVARAVTSASAHRLESLCLTQLVRAGSSISHDLECAATTLGQMQALRRPSETPPEVFNGLFSLSSKLTEVIARSLYRTARLHIVETLMELLDSAKKVPGVADLPFSFLDLTGEMTEVVESICEDIRLIFGFEGRRLEETSPGMAYRGFCMLWPMTVMLMSPYIKEEQRHWVRNKIQHIGKASGFGLVSAVVGGDVEGSGT